MQAFGEMVDGTEEIAGKDVQQKWMETVLWSIGKTTLTNQYSSHGWVQVSFKGVV